MIYRLHGHQVVLNGDGHYIAPSADVIGQVVIGDRSSVWFTAVVRGDDERITIGARSNIQTAPAACRSTRSSDRRAGRTGRLAVCFTETATRGTGTMSDSTVKCPKCKTASLVEMKTPDHVALDFCETCNGLWFDASELAEYLGLSRDLMELDEVRTDATATQFDCPKCDRQLVEMPFSAGSDLLIDFCPGCHGTFFDFREAAAAQSIAAGQQPARERLAVIKQRFFNKGFGG